MAKSIAIGSDDAGYQLKEALKAHLDAAGTAVEDYGPKSPDPIDYPDVALEVAHAVARGTHDRAVLVCGTGIGMAIAANKVPGVYAAVAHDVYSAAKARSSNNAQVLTFGARVVAPELAKTLLDVWLATEFGGGASARKVDKIRAAESDLGSGTIRNRSKGPDAGGFDYQETAMATQETSGRSGGSYKKLINDPLKVVDEALEGFVEAHAGLVALVAPRVIARRTASPAKVGFVVGGGSGHEPAFAGYVGQGIADSAACGNVFASPPPEVVLDAIRAASTGRGVIMGYGNYAGDVMNFGLAAEFAKAEDIDVREIRVSDDVASASRDEIDKRRGIAGDILVFKCVGAAAERGDDIEAVEGIARKANAATHSMGVALSGCEVPGAGRPTFELGPDEIEIGMGVHGEPGIHRGPLQPADDVANALVDTIVADVDGGVQGRDVALLVNGLGATAYLDQYIIYRAARRRLEAAGAHVMRSFVGEFITSLEMSGVSVTVMMLDDELLGLLDAPATTVRFVQ